jgi:hypothetical protein
LAISGIDFRERDRAGSERLALIQELCHETMPIIALPQGIDDDVWGVSFLPELLLEARFRFTTKVLSPRSSSGLELGMVFVLPGAGRLKQRLFLARNEECLADRLCDEAAAVALLNQTVEIGANLFGQRDVSAGRTHG